MSPVSLSIGWLPVWRRNFLVWRKLALPSILGNLADPLIYLLGLGYGLGAMLPSVDGQPYVAFLAAGTVCASTMNSATFEALYSSFSRMHVQKTWDAILNTPLGLSDVVAGELFWAATKSLFSGAAILVVISAMGLTSGNLVLWALPAIVLTGLAFAALGLIWNALAPSYDFFMYYFTLFITPMTLISGVFLPDRATARLARGHRRLAAARPRRCAGSPRCLPDRYCGRCPDPHRRTARHRRHRLCHRIAPDPAAPAQVESVHGHFADCHQLPGRKRRQCDCAGRRRKRAGGLRQYPATRRIDLSLAGRRRIGQRNPPFDQVDRIKLCGA